MIAYQDVGCAFSGSTILKANMELTASAAVIRCSSRSVPRRPLNEGLGLALAIVDDRPKSEFITALGAPIGEGHMSTATLIFLPSTQ